MNVNIQGTFVAVKEINFEEELPKIDSTRRCYSCKCVFTTLNVMELPSIMSDYRIFIEIVGVEDNIAKENFTTIFYYAIKKETK